MLEQHYYSDSGQLQQENILEIDMMLDDTTLTNYKGIHLIVLVHGF